jgi:hypothetical protein
MRLLTQHTLVLLIVVLCGAVVVWQIVQTLIGRKSKLGSCCAKGCDPAPAKPVAPKNATQFIPIERLERRSQI